jgi:uncharacterized protein (TIGR03000 family)
MTRPARPPVIALLSTLALLLLAGAAEAQYRGRGWGPARRPIYPGNRMPGWDWWRIYPWSPYNYGRNPYNPIVYPYVAPYPVYTPAPVTYNVSPPPPDAEYQYGAADSPRQVLVPHPSGALRTPPPDAAVIRLYIPDQFGDVWFDGVKTSSIGTTRYYVTPDLPGEKPLRYTIATRFRRGDETVSEERTVRVSPGKTAVVDFTRPEASK